MEYKLDQDLALVERGNGRFSVEISPAWNIAAPNGGYLLAVLGKALAQALGCACPLSLTAHFHRPTAIAPADLQVTEVAESSRFRTATATLTQEGRAVVTCLGTYLTGRPFDGPSHRRRPGAVVPPLAECEPLAGIPLPFFDQVIMSLPADQVAWMRGETTSDTRFTGWFEFADGRPMDWLATLLFVDATPPPILRYTGPVSWVPTIELGTQIRGVPTGRRVAFRSVTNYATRGLVETDLELFSETGDIVALARQLAVVRSE